MIGLGLNLQSVAIPQPQVLRASALTSSVAASAGLAPYTPTFAEYFHADFAAVSGSDVTSLTGLKNGYVLSPSTSKPTISTAKFGGRNSIRFTLASNQYLINNTTAALYGLADGTNPNISIFMNVVCATAPNEAEFWKFGSTGGSTANRLSAGTISTTSLRLFDNGVTGTASTTFTVADMTAAEHIYCFVLNGTTQNLYVDNVVNGTTGSMSMSSARTSVEFLIGAFDNNVFKGDFYMRHFSIIAGVASANDRAWHQAAWSGL